MEKFLSNALFAQFPIIVGINGLTTMQHLGVTEQKQDLLQQTNVTFCYSTVKQEH